MTKDHSVDSSALSGQQRVGVAHTPGPWEASVFGDVRPVGADYLVATCISPSGRFRDYEANARLIAAAPDLLEALNRFVGAFDGDTVQEIADAYGEGTAANISVGRTAIAKAVGQSPSTALAGVREQDQQTGKS